MDIHANLLQEHNKLREFISQLEKLMASGTSDIGEPFGSFHKLVTTHMKKKDAYYLGVDRDRQVADRVLMHDLRNDHAAVVFTMESLAIRLRKNGLNPEWQKKWSSMVEVLLPHLKREETTLFPMGRTRLSPEDQIALAEKFAALG